MKPYVVICECAVSNTKDFSAQSSSLALFGLSPMDYGKQTSIQSFNSVREEKSKIFSGYKGRLLTFPCWYEVPLGICRSGDLSQARTRAEEHDARETVHLYKKIMF